jgi:hypothetical protein
MLHALIAELILKIVTEEASKIQRTGTAFTENNERTGTTYTENSFIAVEDDNVPIAVKEEEVITLNFVPKQNCNVTESTGSGNHKNSQCNECEAVRPDLAAARCPAAGGECLGHLLTRLTQSQTYWLRLLARRQDGQSSSNFCVGCRRVLNSRQDFLHHIETHHLRGVVDCRKDSTAVSSISSGSTEEAVSSASDPLTMIQQYSEAELRYNTILTLLPSSGELSCDECGVKALPVADFAKHIQLIHLGLDVWSGLNPKYFLLLN